MDGVLADWAFAGTLKAYQRGFPDLVIFLGCNGGRPFYLKPHERVNTILTHLLRLAPLARPGVVRRLRSVHAQPWRTRSEAIAHRPVLSRDNICFSEDDYGLGGGVGRGLGVGANLGVGVGLGVELAVAVAVAVAVGVAVAVAVPVAVAVGVGDAVGPHAEGVPVAVGLGLGVAVGDGVPTAAAISTRPQPYTLFGGPAVPHCVEEINTAELFKASRLSVI